MFCNDKIWIIPPSLLFYEDKKKSSTKSIVLVGTMERGGQPNWAEAELMEHRDDTDEINLSLEGGQQSRNSHQTDHNRLEEHRIDVVEISTRVKDWIESVKFAKDEGSSESQPQWPTMSKVPEVLRTTTRDPKKYYEPRVISIGPYHHGKPHLQAAEKIKARCTKEFLTNSKLDIECLYKKIAGNMEAVKKCYDIDKTDDEKLAWMMLLDGCFILQYILQSTRQEGMGEILREHERCFVQQDLFLLENQLTYGVLKLIFEEAVLGGDFTMEEMIKLFVSPEYGTLDEGNELPSHLLDIQRSALLGKWYKKSTAEQEKRNTNHSEESVRCCPWKKSKQLESISHSFRHVKEIKAAGIYLRRSNTSFLTDISFKSYFFFGYLNLPQIIIDDSTKPLLLNLMAYEMCPEAPNDYAVTSYVSFLYDLIDHADDVEEMRSRHILHNCLGSDEEVAQIFNEIGNEVVDTNVYKKVKVSIQKHYDNRINTWIAQVLHDHFSTPWTVLAFLAAVLILFLTGVQTYYNLPGNV